MRINTALTILKEHLIEYDGIGDAVLVSNIAEPTGQPANSILLTLIKVSEEKTLKNGRYSKVNQNLKTVYKNRMVYTNLFVLFACNHGNYNTALTKLSQVIEFFQGKNVFTHLDGKNAVTSNGDKDEKFKLIVELQDVSFEQNNYIWSSLGGKQFPAVLYKVRMVPLEATDQQHGEGEPILEVNISGTANF